LTADQLGDEEETEKASPQKDNIHIETGALDDDDDLERGTDNVILTNDDLTS
jgi:hypothetical protein